MKMGDIGSAYELVVQLHNLSRDYECFKAGDRLGNPGCAKFEIGGIEITLSNGISEFGNPATQALYDELHAAASALVHRYFTRRMKIVKENLRELGADLDEVMS